jgi:hypothetical protein
MDRPLQSKLWFLLYFFLLFLPQGYCDEISDCVQTFGRGKIDWTNLLFIADGRSGIPEDFSADDPCRSRLFDEAIKEARANLLALVYNMRVDAATLLEEIADADQGLKNKIIGMVNRANLIEQNDLPDGAIEVVVQLPITGAFSQLVLPDEITQLQSIKPMHTKETIVLDEANRSSETVDSNKTKSFSGLVIDASKLNAVPALAPRLLDEQGEQVYGASYISREFAVQNGVCGYTKNLESALINDRVGDSPLVVKGLRTNGPALTDIVISNTDALKIRGSSRNLTVLKKCRVIMILD